MFHIELYIGQTTTYQQTRLATPLPGTQPQGAAFISGKGVHLFQGGWCQHFLARLKSADSASQVENKSNCSVCLIGEDYLVSGQPSKPLLSVWQVFIIEYH